MDGWWPDRLLGQGPDNRTCVRLRHAGCPAQGPPDTPAEIKTTWWWVGRDGYGNPVCWLRWNNRKKLSAPAKNTHLLILTSHKTAAFTINNKASVLFYSSGKNGGGIA